MKCGTTTLHEQLAAQPGVFMTTPKEPNFFSDDNVFARGLPWYQNLFAAGAGKLCGESSTHYTKLPTHPHAAERLHAAYPRAKLIYVMRHPIDRLVSHFVHAWTEGQAPRAIERALLRDPTLVEYGLYAHQLAPYFKRFGQVRVLPVFFEHMRAHPQVALERVANFIGLGGAVCWDATRGQENVSSQRLRTSKWRDAVIHAPVLEQVRRHLVPQAVRDRIKRAWTMPKRPTLSLHTVQRLQRRFNRDLAELGHMLGVALDCANFVQTVQREPLEWSLESRSIRIDLP